MGDPNQSSQRMLVVSVEKEGPGANGITLSDGSFFVLGEEDCRELGVRPGGEIVLGHVAERAAAFERARCHEVAARLLGRREHSSWELRRKLGSRGFSEEAIDHEVERLVQAGYLDDERFARAFLAERMRRRAEATSTLVTRLLARGVPRAMAEQTVAEAVDCEARAQLLARAFQEVMRGVDRREIAEDKRARDKIARRLVSRGFSPSEALRLLEEEAPERGTQ